MLIAVRNRFVFLANSKCGSTTVEHALREHAEIFRGGSARRKHIDWSDARDEYAFLFDQPAYAPEHFFRFGTLRDPLDWLISWYNYRRRARGGDLGADVSFELFWARSGAMRKRRQVDRFLDFDGVCRFDLMVPLERLDDLLTSMVATLRLTRAETVERVNISPKIIRRADVPTHVVAEVEGFFAEDLRQHRDALAHFDSRLPVAMQRLGELSGAPLRGVVRSPPAVRATRADRVSAQTPSNHTEN